MLLFAYHLAWTFFFLFLLPFLLLLRRHRLARRIAFKPPARRIEEGTIWIHALSMGEVLSAIPLVESIRRRFPKEKIVFTVTTRQGMEIARQELEGKVHLLLPLPLDFWWSMLRMIRHVRPKLFILVETDLWPGLLHHLARKGIPSVLVNGRVSPRTLKSYSRFPLFVRRVLGLFHACLMQSELDRLRLLATGIKQESVRTVGNIKFDRDHTPVSERERRDWLEAFGLSEDDPVWLAGSTHRGEEKTILHTFESLRLPYPKLRLIIAPRRTERVEEVQRLFQSHGLKAMRRTALKPKGPSYDALILDTVGELGRVYGIAWISFVGGSLVPEGGHNLLEPASFGCPVLFGPHMADFKVMAELIIEAGGGIQVRDQRELLRAVQDLLSHPEKRKAVGEKARRFVNGNRGALDRVMDELAISLAELPR